MKQEGGDQPCLLGCEGLRDGGGGAGGDGRGIQGKQTLSYWMAFGKVKGEEEVGCWFGLPDCLGIALGVWEKVR